MRQRTHLEEVTDRGGIVRLEICEAKSILKPEWWDIRRRMRWWKLKQSVLNNRKLLDDETQLALAWAEEALERELLYRKDF